MKDVIIKEFCSPTDWFRLRPCRRQVRQQPGHWWGRSPEQLGQLPLYTQRQPGWPRQGWKGWRLWPWRWQRWHSWWQRQLSAGFQPWPDRLWWWVSLRPWLMLLSKSGQFQMWILELLVHFFFPLYSSVFRRWPWWYLQRWLWSRQRPGHLWRVPWEFCHQWNWFPQIPNGAFRPNRHLADRPQLGGAASGQGVGPDCQLWSWHRCWCVRKDSGCDHNEEVITKISFPLRQVTTSSAQWISVGPSSSTRTETMTMLASCLVTSQARASTRWCGNRSHRRTGLPRPRELKVTLACQSKLSIPPLVLVSTWEMPCGTRETPQDRWVSFLAPYWRDTTVFDNHLTK